jgi:hypothetical protein
LAATSQLSFGSWLLILGPGIDLQAKRRRSPARSFCGGVKEVTRRVPNEEPASATSVVS